jgi:hypothetical protein
MGTNMLDEPAAAIIKVQEGGSIDIFSQNNGMSFKLHIIMQHKTVVLLVLGVVINVSEHHNASTFRVKTYNSTHCH